MADGDDLDFNPFFQALQTTFKQQYSIARHKCHLVCIPATDTLQGRTINQRFVETHILRTSPFFQGQYISTDKDGSKTIAVEEGNIVTLEGFQDEAEVRILSEELAYNEDYKPYKILVIERPLDGTVQASASRARSQSMLGDAQRITYQENHQYLFSFPECKKALVRLDRNITEFTNNYMIVTGYLDHAVQKLQGICQQATEDILKLCKRERQIDSIAQAVESYVVGSVHTKMWQAVCQQCQKEESLLQKKLEELRGVTGEQLGVKEAFCCPLPGAVVELATLDGLKTPLEKLSCLKRTLDSVNEEVNAHLRENQDPTSDDLPCLVSDDLILLLVPVLVQARCLHLPSNVFYIENLQWSLSSKDDLGFSLVTFKASLEYMMSADFSQLRATMSPTQKNNEISIPELMQAAQHMTLQPGPGEWEGRGAGAEAESPGKMTSFDRKLESITRMMERSSQELAAAPMPLKSITGETGDQQRAGGKRGEQVPDVIPLRKADKSGLGDFLSSLQDDFGCSYGKQT
ncbi:PREDICTED: ankyrin repeat domain-containing protein 27-like [Branchiostoma belcheri]|uniref:Ankyrin repeat domain-containing protein 27-like n=1 Tax=Branchiostoma belcheri TaxID=7741 RepID=A0A6P5A9H6_BRABE|nr:PREDICTED: ankyrin repeat domain-containing protein 27-like [Branchiostoma belcheri]